MVLGRDRYLDDSTRFHVSLELTTRTTAMHGVISQASPELRGRLGEILVRALDEIAAALAESVAAANQAAQTSSFGCGT